MLCWARLIDEILANHSLTSQNAYGEVVQDETTIHIGIVRFFDENVIGARLMRCAILSRRKSRSGKYTLVLQFFQKVLTLRFALNVNAHVFETFFAANEWTPRTLSSTAATSVRQRAAALFLPASTGVVCSSAASSDKVQLRMSPSLSKCGVENLESLFGSDKFADVVRAHRSLQCCRTAAPTFSEAHLGVFSLLFSDIGFDFAVFVDIVHPDEQVRVCVADSKTLELRKEVSVSQQDFSPLLFGEIPSLLAVLSAKRQLSSANCNLVSESGSDLIVSLPLQSSDLLCEKVQISVKCGELTVKVVILTDELKLSFSQPICGTFKVEKECFSVFLFFIIFFVSNRIFLVLFLVAKVVSPF